VSANAQALRNGTLRREDTLPFANLPRAESRAHVVVEARVFLPS